MGGLKLRGGDVIFVLVFPLLFSEVSSLMFYFFLFGFRVEAYHILGKMPWVLHFAFK